MASEGDVFASGILITVLAVMVVGGIFLFGNSLGAGPNAAIPGELRWLQTSQGHAFLVENAHHQQKIVVDFTNQHVIVDVPASTPVSRP
jgi:Ni,Fe-hydrogenase I cytochrome b subunit